MFELGQSIATWRREMLAAGVKSPVPLDELEGHLREDVARQMKSGLNAEESFNFAAQKIGQAHALAAEFKQAGPSIETRLVKLAGIACGMVGGLFSVWILYVLMAFHETDSTERVLALIAVAAAILSWWRGCPILPNVRNQRARAAIGAICCMASVGGMMWFIENIPNFIARPAGPEIPKGQLLVSFLWAWTAMAVLGAVAYKLNEAARKSSGQPV